MIVRIPPRSRSSTSGGRRLDLRRREALRWFELVVAPLARGPLVERVEQAVQLQIGHGALIA